jgi:hypothetical protein
MITATTEAVGRRADILARRNILVLPDMKLAPLVSVFECLGPFRGVTRFAQIMMQASYFGLGWRPSISALDESVAACGFGAGRGDNLLDADVEVAGAAINPST